MADLQPAQRRIAAPTGANGGVRALRPPQSFPELPPDAMHPASSSAARAHAAVAPDLEGGGIAALAVGCATVTKPALQTAIATAAAPTTTKHSLEPGGRSRCPAFDGVDLTKVASQLAAAATICGKHSTAAIRTLPRSSRCDEMKAALEQALPMAVAAPSDTSGARMRPSIDGFTHACFRQSFDAATAAVDVIDLLGGHPADTPTSGHFVMLMPVADCHTSASIVRDEIVGPFVVLERLEGECAWQRHGLDQKRPLQAVCKGPDRRLPTQQPVRPARRDPLIDSVEMKHVCRIAAASSDGRPKPQGANR